MMADSSDDSGLVTSHSWTFDTRLVLDTPDETTSDRKPTLVLPHCRICSAVSSGIHYGVTSCEGCKGFFRRCLSSKTLIVECQRSGHCSIDKMSRGRCAHCRYEKCLAVGMSVHSVRVGRYSKKQRAKNIAEIASLSTKEKVLEREERDRRMHALIQRLVRAYDGTCFTIKIQTQSKSNQSPLESFADKVQDDLLYMAAQQHALKSTEPIILDPELVYAQVCAVRSFLTDVLTPSVANVVKFSKNLPGFCDLLQEDQLTLLKASFFEVWLIRTAPFLKLLDGDLVGFGGPKGCKKVHTFQLSDLRQMGGEDGFWQMVFDFVRRFTALEMIKEELAVFTSVVILCADRHGLQEPHRVDELQTELVEVLKREITRRDWKNRQLFARLLMEITMLRAVSVTFNKCAGQFRKAWPHMTIPALLEEIISYED